MTSNNDEQKFIDSNFSTVNYFKGSTFEESTAIVILTFS